MKRIYKLPQHGKKSKMEGMQNAVERRRTSEQLNAFKTKTLMHNCSKE